MRRNARFWRNVILIALVHLGALVALLRWAGSSKIAAAQEITWLNTGGEPMATADLAKAEETPTPDPERKSSPPEENQHAVTKHGPETVPQTQPQEKGLAKTERYPREKEITR